MVSKAKNLTNNTKDEQETGVGSAIKVSANGTGGIENVVSASTVRNNDMAADALGIKPYSLEESEEYMSSAQQKHFKELLHAWRIRLSAKIDEAVSQLKDDPKHFADLNDRATQEEEFTLELKARDREADLMIRIDEALKRLHEGEYGYCEECGIEIGIRRLEARPTATECIDCKTLSEMRQRQAGGC